MRIDVHDKGFVELLDVFGDDLTVVNAARVSFGKRKEKLDEDDKRLIDYLARNKHDSPFRHLMFRFHIKWEEATARQGFQHVVGIEATSSYPTKDHAWNEISSRYVPMNEFYVPDEWRKQSEDNKQGSSGLLSATKSSEVGYMYRQSLDIVRDMYQELLDMGVAKEQARLLLPVSFYTQVYWTASFQAIMNFIQLRDDEHAQWEIRQYAKAIRSIVQEVVPVSFGAWEKHRLH